MTGISFKSTLRRDDGTTQDITVHFDFFVPENPEHWHDAMNGSLRLIQLEDDASEIPLSSLSVLEHASLRHQCWNFLEESHLIHVTQEDDTHSFQKSLETTRSALYKKKDNPR